MEEIKFGTEGWRGVIAKDFTLGNVRIVANAIADYLSLVLTSKEQPLFKNVKIQKGAPSIVIGYDNRFLSEKFAQVCSEVFSKYGYKTYLSDTSITTPNLDYSIKSLNATIGIMITASHNPPEFNGLKIKAPYGGPIPGWVAEKVEEKIPAAALKSEQEQPSSVSQSTTDLKPGYIDYLKLSTDFQIIKKIKQKIILDSLYGPSYRYLPELFTKNKLINIRNYRDPLFGGIHPEPISVNLELLRKTVRKEKAIVGIAFDGDGDRLGVVDDKGKYLPPHLVFPLLLYYLAKYKQLSGKVVQTISLGYISERIAKEYNMEFKETSVGFKYICEQMLEDNNVLIGGEESGGYAARGEIPDRDGILCGMIILEMIASTGKKISDLVNEIQKKYGKSCFQRKDLTIEKMIYDKKDFVNKVSNFLPDKLLNKKISEIRTYDGIKMILSDDSWLLLRPSGTEPLVRIYAETPSLETTKKLIDIGVKNVKNYLGRKK